MSWGGIDVTQLSPGRADTSGWAGLQTPPALSHRHTQPNQGTAQASSHLMVSPRSTNLPALASKAFWSTSSDADVCSQVSWVLPQSITHSASPAQCHQPGCLSSPEFWCQSLLITVNPSVFHLTDSASSSCTWDCASTLLSLFHLCSCLWTLANLDRFFISDSLVHSPSPPSPQSHIHDLPQDSSLST